MKLWQCITKPCKRNNRLVFLHPYCVSDSLWFRHSAFCSMHLSLLLCLAGETAAINKTLRWSIRPAAKYWSQSSLYHFGVRANMISHHSIFCFSVLEKNPFCIEVALEIQKHIRALGDTYSADITKKKHWYFMMTCYSNPVLLWYEILKAKVCWCWLWSLLALLVFCSSPPLSDQIKAHSNMCFRLEFPPELTFTLSTTMMTS